MPLYGLTIHTNIAEAAAHAGLAPTPEQIDLINTLGQSLGETTDDGHVVIDGLEPAAFIHRELAGMKVAAVCRSEPQSETVPVGASLKAGTLSFGDLIKRSHAAETAREVATWPNPWRKGAENRTRQAIIQNTNPALAASYRAEAAR